MKFNNSVISLTVANILLLTNVQAAGAKPSATFINKTPQTILNTSILPVVTTTRKSSIIKPNSLNPYPVCNAFQDKRTVVYKVTDQWLPVGTISTYNSTNMPIPLTQTAGKSQTVAISVNAQQSSSVSANIGGGAQVGSKDKGGANSSWGIAASLARTIGGNASYSLTWSYDQKIGPYNVPAGHTGKATFGFRAINMTGTQQYCKMNGTWSNPTAWTAFVPIQNEIRVSMYKTIADSIDTAKPVYDTTFSVPQPPTDVSKIKPQTDQKHDLQVRLSSYSGKAIGYSGFVGIHVKNVGTDDYKSHEELTSFLVQVKSIGQVKKVDRMIKAYSKNGSHIIDLGFDREKSIRSFIITLSNPVYLNEEVKIGNFFFGDGLTKYGRINNSITVTQIKRMSDDKTYYNDHEVSSLENTTNLSGRKLSGKF